MYTHPILRDLEFAWRLDDDSRLLGPDIDYDVFKFMKDNGLVYGYNLIINDFPQCVYGLWEAAENYTKLLRMKGQFLGRWPQRRTFFNNFEISDLSIWRTREYRGFLKYIDDLGGVYKYRWGDAPIKSLGLAMFVSSRKIYRFKHIGYQHPAVRIQGLHHTPTTEPRSIGI